MNASAQVGVGVILVRDDRVLLGQRLGSHGAGTWAMPGGHLEFGESIEQCASREVEEETGLKLTRISHAAYTNNVFKDEGKHYVTLFVLGHGAQGEPRLCEPNKCAGWGWYLWNALPAPLFPPLETLVQLGFKLPIEG